MKKCPVCFQIFGEENDYCLNDGTPLVAVSGTQGFGAARSTSDMPTQFMPHPVMAIPPPSRDGSAKMLYLVIGVLATALVGVGLYLFLAPGAEKRADALNTNSIPSVAASPLAPTNKPAVAAAPPGSAGAAPPGNAGIVSPNGNWTGELLYSSGSAFSAEASLADAGGGQVKGQILWTLMKTTNPQKADMTGKSATEFVQGTFDPATRTLLIAGYNTSDPNNLIIMDKYRLTLSADGRAFSGSSYGGKIRGQINLHK